MYNIKNKTYDWYLASYHDTKSNLVGGQRFYFLHKYLLARGINAILFSKELAYSQNEQYVSEPPITRRFYKVISLFSITDASWVWSWRIAKSLKKNTYPTILQTGLPPYGMSWVGLHLRRFNIPFFWIVDLRDPWLLNPIYNPILSFIKKPIQAILQKKIFKSADLIIFNTELDLEKHIRGYPILRGKSIVVRNGFTKQIQNCFCQKKDNTNINLIYAGSAYPKGAAAKAIIAFLNKLNKKGLSVNCDFYGNYHSSLKNARFIEYRGKKQHHEIPQLLSTYRMGIIFLQKKCIGGGRITQKFYDYIASGVIPIVINPSIEILRHLKIIKLGISVLPEDDIIQIASKIHQIYFSKNSFDEIDLDAYSREHQFNQLMKYMKPIIDKLERKETG